MYPTFHLVSCTSLFPGNTARKEAWLLKRLVSRFTRGAGRGHYPREQGMRNIFLMAGIALPTNPRFSAINVLLSFKLSSNHISVKVCTCNPGLVEHQHSPII